MASPSRPAPIEPLLVSEPGVEQPQPPSGPEMLPPPSPLLLELLLAALELLLAAVEAEPLPPEPPMPLLLLAAPPMPLLLLAAPPMPLPLLAALPMPLPLLALPAWMFGWTRTFTESVADPPASLTFTWKVKIVSPRTGGAIHVGFAICGLLSGTMMPVVCVQSKLSARLLGDELPDASRITPSPT